MKGKGRIVYTYDAAGTKWKKTITDSLARHSTTILYIGGFVYQQNDTITNADGGVDTLQFMAHEEGRARWAFQKFTTGTMGYSFQYDFFEKDHLGNTRMVLTQERDTTKYLASMEAAYRSTESQLFGNIASTSVAFTSMPNYQNIPSGVRYLYGTTNDSVSKVDYTGSGGQTTGPSLLLKVMSGDTVQIGVQCYYNSNNITTNNSSFTSVLNSLAMGLLGTASGAAEGTLTGFTSSAGTVYGGLSSFLGIKDSAHPAGYPKAYLNYIFLDDQFNYVSSLSGAIPAASATYPAGSMNPVALGSPIALNKSGYLYIWVSNETQGWDVFFDNLAVQYKQGPLLEENHYYPFGLTMAGISDKVLKTNYAENKYRANGGDELQNKEFSDGSGLELYDANFRSYDPQIGRFHQTDPLGEINEDWSPYSFANDNPVLLNDPLGLANDSTPTNVTPPPPKKDPDPTLLPSVTVTHVKKDCKTCGAPDPGASAGAAPAGVPALPINPLTPVGPPGKVVPFDEPILDPLIEVGVVEEASQVPALLALLGRVGGTIGGGLIPTSAPGEGLNWHPYPGHGNNKDNSNPHIVYAFGFAATDGKTPILKYGISDEYRNLMNRPESQLAGLRAKYGPTVMYSIYARTISRQMALLIEADLVKQHKDMWNGALPREQLKPNP